MHARGGTGVDSSANYTASYKRLRAGNLSVQQLWIINMIKRACIKVPFVNLNAVT